MPAPGQCVPACPQWCLPSWAPGNIIIAFGFFFNGRFFEEKFQDEKVGNRSLLTPKDTMLFFIFVFGIIHQKKSNTFATITTFATCPDTKDTCSPQSKEKKTQTPDFG